MQFCHRVQFYHRVQNCRCVRFYVALVRFYLEAAIGCNSAFGCKTKIWCKDEYDDLFWIHKGGNDLSCIEARWFGGNCSLCFGFLLIIEDQWCILVRDIIIVVNARFLNGDCATAIDIAKKQVEDGSHLIDIKVANGMLDGIAAMQKFLKIVITESEVSKSIFMLDASKFEIVMVGLKWYQGKQL